MIKCTQVIFAESSPSGFYRNKKGRRITKEEGEISDQQIIEKLQLILISLREEAAKASLHLQNQNTQLQQKADFQTILVTYLSQENFLMTQILDTYIEKYGQISPQLCQIQKAKKATISFCAQHSPNPNLINLSPNLINLSTKLQNIKNNQTRNQSYINMPSESSSQLSTNQISAFYKTPNLKLESLTYSIQMYPDFTAQTPNQTFSTRLSSGLSSQAPHDRNSTPTSANSNFQKLFQSYHEATQQNESRHSLSNPPSLKHKKSRQICKISQVQTSHQNNDSNNDKSINQAINEYPSLGLYSRGSNFFQQPKVSCLDNPDKDLNTEYSNTNINFEDTLIVNEKAQVYKKSQRVSESMKKNHDKQRVKSELQTSPQKINIRSQEEQNDKKFILSEIALNKLNSKMELINIKDDSYFNSIQFYNKRKCLKDDGIDMVKESNIAKDQQIIFIRKELKDVQKKLKALLGPLPYNLISKKVSLPKKSHEFINHYGQEILKIQQLKGNLVQQEQKKPKSN